MGGLKKVSDAIGLSPEMLRQFSRVERLSPETKKLVYKGVIQSVDIADRISRLPMPDQLPVAQAVARGELGDDDVRTVVSLKKELPKIPITEVITRVQASRNIKEYVVQFLVSSKEFKKKDLEIRFIRLLGKKNFISLSVKNGVGTLIFNTAGRNRLQEVAKRKGLTKRRLIEGMLVGEVE